MPGPSAGLSSTNAAVTRNGVRVISLESEAHGSFRQLTKEVCLSLRIFHTQLNLCLQDVRNVVFGRPFVALSALVRFGIKRPLTDCLFEHVNCFQVKQTEQPISIRFKSLTIPSLTQTKNRLISSHTICSRGTGQHHDQMRGEYRTFLNPLRATRGQGSF